MITVVTHVTLQPGKESAWEAAFQERIAVAKQQPGWISVQLDVPSHAQNKRIIIGTWESRRDWESWHTTQAFQKTREDMAHTEAAPREQWWHDVALAEYRH